MVGQVPWLHLRPRHPGKHADEASCRLVCPRGRTCARRERSARADLARPAPPSRGAGWACPLPIHAYSME